MYDLALNYNIYQIIQKQLMIILELKSFCYLNIKKIPSLNLSLWDKKNSFVTLLKTGEKFSSLKSVDFSSIDAIILSSYSSYFINNKLVLIWS